MTKKQLHKASIALYFSILLLTLLYFGYLGFRYYNLPIVDRYYDPMYNQLKPSGPIGHWLGIVGTAFILLAVVIYMARKRMKTFRGIGTMKYWLEFHIFLCTWGAILVLFHTSFKFGGIVSVAFWSMAIVWLSGFVGRYIYVQIPRTIDGRELSLKEVQDFRETLVAELMTKYNFEMQGLETVKLSAIDKQLKANNVSDVEIKKINLLINKERRLGRRIKNLTAMRNVFKKWHVIHLPFSIIMLVITIIHIAVALYFGYTGFFK